MRITCTIHYVRIFYYHGDEGWDWYYVPLKHRFDTTGCYISWSLPTFTSCANAGYQKWFNLLPFGQFIQYIQKCKQHSQITMKYEHLVTKKKWFNPLPTEQINPCTRRYKLITHRSTNSAHKLSWSSQHRTRWSRPLLSRCTFLESWRHQQMELMDKHNNYKIK